MGETPMPPVEARSVVVETFVKAPVPEVSAPREAVSAAPVVSAPPALTFDEDEDDDLPRPGKVWDHSGPSLKELLAAEQAKQGAAAGEAKVEKAPESFSNVEPVGDNDLQGVWRTLMELMTAHGPMLQSLLAGGNLARVEADHVVIRYSKKNETFTKILERNGKKDLVREGLAKILGRPVGLRFEIVEDQVEEAPTQAVVPPARPVMRAVSPPPPPEPAGPPAIRITPELVEEMKKDPLVAAVMEKLNATPVKIE
jgi:hypothetical protein